MGSFRLSAVLVTLLVLGEQSLSSLAAAEARWSFPAAFAEAVEKAGTPSSYVRGAAPVRAHAFLQPVAKKQSTSSASSQLQQRQGANKVEGISEQLAVRLTQQVALGAEHLDELLSECEAFRQAKQAEIERLIGEVSEVSAKMANNAAQQSEASGALSLAKSQAFQLYDEVDYGRDRCKKEAQTNRVETKKIYDQIVFAKKLLNTDCETLKAGSGGSALLQGAMKSAQNSSMTMSELVKRLLCGSLLQANHSTDAEEGAEKSQQPVVANVPNNPRPRGPSGGVCEIPMGEVPCSRIYTDVRSAIARLWARYTEATGSAREQEMKCIEEEKGREEAMALSRSSNSEANTNVAAAMSALADLKAERDGKLSEQAKAQKELDEKNYECKLDAETLESEIADAVRARRANYERAGGDPEQLIIDCRVTDWQFGECSQPCAQTKDSYGWMVGVRTIESEPQNGGMTCPSLQTRQKCGSDRCPVDCMVSQWAPWTKCNKACGGGMQTRTRQVRSPSAHGGLVCPVTTERRQCNAESCEKNCELSDWTAWSTCSRVCRFSPRSPAGLQHRKREVISEASAEGECPAADSDARLHEQDCNTGLCPANFTCTPDNQDVIVMIDGSFTGDFDAGLNVTRELVKRAGNSTRFGLTVYGDRASSISALTEDKKALSAALDKAAEKGPPKGETDIAGGLALVKTMLVTECSNCPRTRRETVLLLTDGSPLSLGPTETMVRRLRAQGVLIKLGLAHQGQKADSKRNACALASPPCAENVEVFETWAEMAAEPERLVSALCHGLKAPPAEEPEEALTEEDSTA